MTCNERGITLIKQFEGLRLTSYLCPAHVWTIGYGHTHYVGPNQTITEEQADLLLWSDVHCIEERLNRLLANIPVNSNEFSAIVSLTFNIGLGNIEGSTLLRMLKVDRGRAADEFLCWDHVGHKVIPGLLKRREAERDLFLSQDEREMVDS